MRKCENEVISKSANKLISTLVSLILTLSLLSPNSLIAQKTDSVIKIKADTNNKTQDARHTYQDSVHVKKHSPTKATIMSAIVPGLGQVYNHKYWKLPILYGGIAVIGYFIKFNSKWHNYWLNPPKDVASKYSATDLYDLQNYYERDLELTYIIGGLVYVLNILDAAVDANLYDYNMNNDLSFRVEPTWYPSYNKNVNFVMKLTIRLK